MASARSKYQHARRHHDVHQGSDEEELDRGSCGFRFLGRLLCRQFRRPREQVQSCGGAPGTRQRGRGHLVDATPRHECDQCCENVGHAVQKDHVSTRRGREGEGRKDSPDQGLG